MSRKDFLDTYWDRGTGRWRYPDHDGFATVHRGGTMVPDRHTETLVPGQRIDRFGPENGRFLSPEGTPFPDRALPPDSLIARPGDHAPHGYHRYEVTWPFQVSSGPAAPAFGQSGGGIQHYLDSSLYPPGAGRVKVEWLVKNGFLRRIGLGRA
jgi:Tuberculosis necrotizing toxin